MNDQSERDAVKNLGEALGYGRVMQLCEELWRESLRRIGTPEGGALSVGPRVGALVPCPCVEPVGCPWCCGTGRVTEKARDAEVEQERLLDQLKTVAASIKPEEATTRYPNVTLLHLRTQDGQPYGGVRLCCEVCGVAIVGFRQPPGTGETDEPDVYWKHPARCERRA